MGAIERILVSTREKSRSGNDVDVAKWVHLFRNRRRLARRSRPVVTISPVGSSRSAYPGSGYSRYDINIAVDIEEE